MKTTTRDIVRTGNVYLIPLLQDKWAVGKVLNLRAPNPMLIGLDDAVVTGPPQENLPISPKKRYWCQRSFASEGDWMLVRREAGWLWWRCLWHDRSAVPERSSSQISVWATYELFLDDLRQHLGLERQTYTGAQFTFSRICSKCTKNFDLGRARCPNCGTIRGEFAGMEPFVTDHTGFCCLSGAKTDVKGPDGEYYWAPYFIDKIRNGEITITTK